jgi:hypothetical protein
MSRASTARCGTNASTGNSCSASRRPVSSLRITDDTTTRNAPTAASVTVRQPRPAWKLLAPIALRAPSAKSLNPTTPLLPCKLNPEPHTRFGPNAGPRSPCHPPRLPESRIFLFGFRLNLPVTTPLSPAINAKPETAPVLDPHWLSQKVTVSAVSANGDVKFKDEHGRDLSIPLCLSGRFSGLRSPDLAPECRG